LTGRVKRVTIDGMFVLMVAVFALLGMAIGSFLNVLIDRLPAGQSVVFPPSHCPSCQRRLSVPDLIPVLSYLWLRGRCRYCRTKIPRRLLWVEIGTAAIFVYLYWHFGLSAELMVLVFYFCLFIVLMVIDLERGLILNRVVYPAVMAPLVLSAMSEFLPRLGFVPGIASAAGGGAIGLGLFLLIIIVSRGGMGWGDVKMAALVGLVTGFPLVFVALFLAVVLGGLIAWLLVLFKARGRKQSIPFAPFLSLGAMLTLLWGSAILSWYLRLF
jgi:leader peptidase (prepilin peptidase)/N-methyltransferase